MKPILHPALLALIAALCAARPGAPAAAAEALSKEELLNRLETQQAQLKLEQARAAMQRAQVNLEEVKRLFEEKIETVDTLNTARQQFEEARLAFEQARIELEKTRLEFLKGATLVTVVDAKKYRGEDNEVMVAVRIRNDSDINKARVAMGGAKSISKEKLASLLKIDNLIVSLRDTAIVGDPFQRIVPMLRYGEEVTLTYRLLNRDVDRLTVNIEFLETEKPYTVFLKKEATQDLPTVNSTQYAQQGQLGTKVRYDLELERLAKTEQSFSLVVLNLPAELPFVFLDPGSGAHITQLKFTGHVSKQNLQFEVSIPQKLREDLVDANIGFTLLVTRQKELKNIYALRQKHGDKPIPAEEIAALKGNKVNLILIPKGTGKLDLVIGNLLKEMKQEQKEAVVKFSILNSGTLVLRRVTPEADPPLEWEATLAPKELTTLEPGEKKMVTLTLTPPPSVPVGEYTLTIKCEGHAGSETVEATEKDITVRVTRKSNITGTLILVGILVVLVLAIAIASVKISRR